jgi:hypothetical protein
MSDAEDVYKITTLAKHFSIVTNFSSQLVCAGDSRDAGFDCYGFQTWPRIVSWMLPEVAVYNQGIGGSVIGTNGGPTGETFMYGNANSQIDALYTSGRLNLLNVAAGINDQSGGLTGHGVYGELTNYFNVLTNPWSKQPTTIEDYYANDSNPSTSASNLNYLLRTVPSSYWSNICDSGAYSPYITNFNASLNNTLNYTDGWLHETNGPLAGYNILGIMHAQSVNWQRKVGFFQ